MWSERKHGLSAEQVPVSAYVGSSKNLKDLKDLLSCTPAEWRGTSLIRNTHPPRMTIGPEARACCRVLEGGVVSYERGTPVDPGGFTQSRRFLSGSVDVVQEM